eukprot:4829470-Amphidinium_carterae.1
MTEVKHVGFLRLHGHNLHNGLTGETIDLTFVEACESCIQSGDALSLVFEDGYGVIIAKGKHVAYASTLLQHNLHEQDGWFFQVLDGSSVWLDRSLWEVQEKHLDSTVSDLHVQFLFYDFKQHSLGSRSWFPCSDLQVFLGFGAKAPARVVNQKLEYWCIFAQHMGLSTHLLFKRSIQANSKVESIWDWGDRLLTSSTGFMLTLLHT